MQQAFRTQHFLGMHRITKPGNVESI